MRFVLLAFGVAWALAASAGEASAADGCSFGPYGRIYCLPGAQPGVPYYGGYGYGYGYGYNPYYAAPRYIYPRYRVKRPKIYIR